MSKMAHGMQPTNQSWHYREDQMVCQLARQKTRDNPGTTFNHQAVDAPATQLFQQGLEIDRAASSGGQTQHASTGRLQPFLPLAIRLVAGGDPRG